MITLNIIRKLGIVDRVVSISVIQSFSRGSEKRAILIAGAPVAYQRESGTTLNYYLNPQLLFK